MILILGFLILSETSSRKGKGMMEKGGKRKTNKLIMVEDFLLEK